MGRVRRRSIGVDHLLRAAQAAEGNDTWAMNEIVRSFRPLARRLVGAVGASAGLQDDLENAAYGGLVAAVRRHRLGRPGFPAFAEAYMRGAVWREYKRLRQAPPSGPIPASAIQEAEPSAERTALERMAPWGDGPLAGAVAMLSPDQRRLLVRRYVDDAPLTAIAAEAGTSSSAVCQRFGTIHRAVADSLAA